MLTFENVTIAYPGGEPVLEDLSFEIKEGEQVALIGANGSGKSTLLKAALGLIPVRGRITVDGVDLKKDTLAVVRKKMGFVLQNSDNQMFLPTVLDDMLFGPMNYGASREDAEQKVDEVLETLSLSHLKNRHNHKLSGGEKRMAAIATVLAMEPGIMLMDEPSSALDPYHRRKLINTLKKISCTKLIATHDLDFCLDCCDRVILLGEQGIVADGPAAVILRDRALLEANHLELPLSLSGN